MSTFIQLHFLTSYGPSNLNRDDLGRPKSAYMGGALRIRVSSQSLKRAWRKSDTFLEHIGGGAQLGWRTKEIGEIAYRQLIKGEGALEDEAAHKEAVRIATVFAKMDSPKKIKGEAEAAHQRRSRVTGQLVHLSAAERAGIQAVTDGLKAKQTYSDAELGHALLKGGVGTADIALFGRMLANNPDHNVEAACQVAHAISVHEVIIEDDYFTAVDDLNGGEGYLPFKAREDEGTAHIGSVEFAAPLLYHYICVNEDQLIANMGGDAELAAAALRGLTQAALTVSPTGKQNTFASRQWAAFALAERGQRQPRSLSAAFLKPITGQDQHSAAVSALRSTRDRMDAIYGPSASASCWFDALAGEHACGPLADGQSALDGLVEFVARGPA